MSYQDIVSPATSPLLTFFQGFAREKRDYSDVIKERDSKTLWGIGGKVLIRPCSSSDQSIGYESSVENPDKDESEQDKDAWLKIVNGPGLEAVASAPSVTIVGAGVSGLVAGYELKRAKFDVRILEASSRVGGRVNTLRDPLFAPSMHCEAGAMRIPGNHYLLHAYISNFGIDSLFPFEMTNKFIYLSDYCGGTTLTYDAFNKKLQNSDSELLKLFPNLKDSEKGKTCDELFFEAVKPVVELYKYWYDRAGDDESAKIHTAYQKVTDTYDKYTLRSYLLEVALWSFDALRLFDLGNAHVVFDNGFIESWKDAFLSSNTSGAEAGMEQLQNGMDQVPKAFISSDRGKFSLAEDIAYGARVTSISDIAPTGGSPKVRVEYESDTGYKQNVTSDFVVFANPYTTQRAITKSRPFAPAMEQAIRDVRYIEITKILLQYRKRWWEDVFTKHSQGTDGGLISDLPIRYTMFPRTAGNEQFKDSERGVVMAAYTFQQDATILGTLTPERRVRIAAENLDKIFPSANSLQYLEVGVSRVFPSDELAGGSAFCYFGPGQKSLYLDSMCTPDWPDPEGSHNYRVFFAGEHASYTHGWIHGAMEAGLRCAVQAHEVALARESSSWVWL